MGSCANALFLGLMLALLAGPAAAQERKVLPIFDAHVHYSEPAWGPYPVEDVARRLRAAGVEWALVSSSPDEGTLKLVAAAPDRYLPFLRPYRGAVGSSNWTGDPGLFECLEGRLAARPYAGIGEFHVHSVGARERETLARLVRLSEARGLYLHVHSDARPVEVLFELSPRTLVLWAHAGMSEPAGTVGALLDRYPTLITEVSFRAGDIAPEGKLAPEWRAVMLRHADRIMIGSDTYVNGRWEGYQGLIDAHRAWLAQLPEAAAEQIAWRNAVRVFRPRHAP